MSLRTNLVNSLQLYDVFVNTSKDGKVSAEGLEYMKKTFDSVLEEDRALVFSMFLTFLQDDGYEFDVEQFQAA